MVLHETRIQMIKYTEFATWAAEMGKPMKGQYFYYFYENQRSHLQSIARVDYQVRVVVDPGKVHLGSSKLTPQRCWSDKRNWLCGSKARPNI